MANKSCDNKYCAGRRSAFVKDECEGSINDGDDQDLHHCVNCGWLSWVCKGLSCDRCDDYYCACCYQSTFTIQEFCAESNQGESEYSDMAFCSFCAIAHIACDHETCATHTTRLIEKARKTRDIARDEMAKPEPPKPSNCSASDTPAKKRKLNK